ncbi:hypothetical protein P3L10_014138 [Capsicum annuum]
MALRDLSINVAKMKRKLPLSFGNDITCYRDCTSDSDCSDGTYCRTCSQHSDIMGYLPDWWNCSMF